MSQRSRKSKREGNSTPAPDAARDKRKKRRWRVTLLVAVAGVTMLALSLIGGLQPPMLTLYNKTGGPLNDIRIAFPGGEGKAAPVPDGSQTTLVLRPTANAPKPAGPHFIRLDVVMPDGKAIVIRSSALAKEAGSHEEEDGRTDGDQSVGHKDEKGPDLARSREDGQRRSSDRSGQDDLGDQLYPNNQAYGDSRSAVPRRQSGQGMSGREAVSGEREDQARRADGGSHAAPEGADDRAGDDQVAEPLGHIGLAERAEQGR